MAILEQWDVYIDCDVANFLSNVARRTTRIL